MRVSYEFSAPSDKNTYNLKTTRNGDRRCCVFGRNRTNRNRLGSVLFSVVGDTRHGQIVHEQDFASLLLFVG